MKLTEKQKEIIKGIMSEFHIGDGVDDCAGNDDVAMKKGFEELFDFLESL